MSDKSKVLVIYHGGCDDGFAAAWCVRHALGPNNIEVYPGVYQKDPPDVTDRDVVLVDFSYKRPVLEAMAKVAKSVLILDHHKTAAEDLAGFAPATDVNAWMQFRELDGGNNICALFDMNRSGAGIAWDFFHPGMLRPGFIAYIEDRDLWRKSLPSGDEFTIALRSYPQDFAVWDKLVNRGLSLIDEGRDIQRYYRMRVEELKKEARLGCIDGYHVPVANAPYFAASEVAGELAVSNPFAACFFQRADGMWQYSLRSRDGGVDVSEIAKKFGGGGHKGAAGFAVQWPIHFLSLQSPLNRLARECRAANDTWWRDPETGEPIKRNTGELMMLMVSEISEAMEGARKNLMDDHLPHRKSVEVEMADALIRIFDFAGEHGLDLDGAVAEKRAYNAKRADHKPENRLAAGGKAW